MVPLLHIKESDEGEESNTPSMLSEIAIDKTCLPLFPVEETIVFPYMTFSLRFIAKNYPPYLEKIYRQEGNIGIIATKDSSTTVKIENLYRVGTVAKILKVIHVSDEEKIAVLQGKMKFRIDKVNQQTPYPTASITLLEDTLLNVGHKQSTTLVRMGRETALSMLSYMSDVPKEVSKAIEEIQNPDFLIYYIASFFINFEEKQKLLSLHSGVRRAKYLLKCLFKSFEYLKLQKKIHRKVYTNISDQQRSFFLKQQMKVLQEELGEKSANSEDELTTLHKKGKRMQWPLAVNDHFQKTLQRVEVLHPTSAEYANLINYAHTLVGLPWGIYSKKSARLDQAQKMLDKEHYGMSKAKERILSILSVQQLTGSQKGKVICLHGTPGVGKTSICKTIAKTLSRESIFISLGGLHDEMELRGSRKTYVGAMMGRIMTSIKKAGVSNPLIILDEIDKLDMARGNPAAVLLEILDKDQNHQFTDNYLEVPFDCSKVLFMATANDIYRILPALADRLEMIEIEGYALEEKVEIAKRHLIAKVRKENGLKAKELSFASQALAEIITQYTNESGVRALYQQLDILCSKIAKALVLNLPYPKKITPAHLKGLLGSPKFDKNSYTEIHTPGVATGLAWTPTGGEVLLIEALSYQGEGKIIVSGQLGEVMEESAFIAFSYLKANADKLDISDDKFKKHDLHIHVPDGATPKDGPSAGITISIALISLYTGRKVKKVAMTGEMTLTGTVLPVGGIREKVLAAQRMGIKEIIMSKKNEKDVEEIDACHIKGLAFHYITSAKEAIEIALEPNKTKK